MSTNDNHLLFETYKLHAELAESIASSREDLNKLYASMVATIVAASVLLHRFAPDTDTVWVLPVLGIIVSLSWMLSLHSITGKLCAKHEILIILEQKLPFQFLGSENAEFEKDGFLRRRITGLIMPIAFLVLCVVWLGFMYSGGSCSA